MRRNVQPRLLAIALASTVLPVPGTSSIRRWPLHSSATRAKRTSLCLPTMTRSTLAMTWSPTCWIPVMQLPSMIRGVSSDADRPSAMSRDGTSGRPGRFPLESIASERHEKLHAGACGSPSARSTPADVAGGSPDRHQRADPGHRAQEHLVRGECRDRDAAEERGHEDRDAAHCDALDQRPRRRPIVAAGAWRIADGIAGGHAPAQVRQARKSWPAIGDALTPPPPEGSTSTAIATLGLA